MSREAVVSALLKKIEHQLRELDLWGDESPSPEALASVQPFCIDTLGFSQWLQFVFIERLSVMIAQKARLPTNCHIIPVAEEYFKSRVKNAALLLSSLKQLDDLLSSSHL
jgi:uncharacterized protein YqcC (DUF446 family)